MSNIELDPREVLMHLHEMGYYNITPQQLDEFITDLKKLIKSDIAKKKDISKPSTSTKMHYTEESTSSTIPNTTDESVSPSPHPPPDQHKHWAHLRPGRSQSKHMDEASYSSSNSSITPSKRVLRECTKIAAQRAQEKDNIIKNKHTEASRVPAKTSKSCDCLWRRIGCKCCDEREQNSIKTAKSKENLAPPRPKSSFIRTWQLTGQARPGSAPQRSDPVSLYHQYQRLWKQQKLPGENNHNDLRWSVRERMLGQEPHPRSCSCKCCKCCPCELREAKRVSSRLLPRGPFHVDGRMTGPLGFGQDGRVTVCKRNLKGVFQLASDCEEIKLQHQPQPPTKYGTNKTRERAAWLSKEDMEKARKLQDDVRSTANEFRITEEELGNRRANHDKSTCKYCGVIHYMLNVDSSGHKPESSKGSSKIPYWPEQFSRNGVHRKDVTNGTSSVLRRSTQPSATSTPLSAGRRTDGQTFVVPKPRLENQPVDSCARRSSDNYFESRVPIKLNGLEGEVKTGIEMFRRQRTCNGQQTRNGNNTEPLFVVALEVKINQI